MKRRPSKGHRAGPAKFAPPPGRRAEAQFREFEATIPAGAPARWPSISACLIVKNEADHLGPCLSSLADLPSEIIVVDTGSTDATVEIARAHGATVHEFAWANDFAAARNESLRHATKQWIFWLDADDRLKPQSVAQLKRAAASGLADAYMCQVRSAVPGGGEEVTEHVRLFRNRLGIRFTKAIHESLWPDLVRVGARVAHTDIEVTHTGYNVGPEAMRLRHARNLAIVEEQLALYPDRMDLIYTRGQARSTLGDLAGAEADLRTYLASGHASSVFQHMRFWAYTSLLAIFIKQGRRQELKELLAESLAEFPGHPYLALAAGCQARDDGRLQEAEALLQTAYEGLDGDMRGFRPPRWEVALNLADCYRKLERREEAIRRAEEAWAGNPASRAAGILLARLYVETGQVRAAEALCRELVGQVDHWEPWLILAELRMRQGLWDDAVEAIRQGRSRGLSDGQAEDLLAQIQAAHVLVATRRDGPVSPQQVQGKMQGLALLAKGEFEKAAESFADAIEAAPDDADNYRYFAVALRKIGREEEAVQVWQVAQALAA